MFRRSRLLALFVLFPVVLVLSGHVAAGEPLSIVLAPLTPVEVGAAAEASVTISGGLPPYTVTWTFGDGAVSAPLSESSISHVYTQPGHMGVTVLVVDASGSQRMAFASRLVHRTLTAAQPASSQPVLVAADARVWVCNPDHGTVAIIHPVSLERQMEVTVGAHPVALAQAGNGEVWVVCRDADAIHRLDASSGAQTAIINLPYGSAPTAIAADPIDGTLVVVCQGRRRLLRFDALGNQLAETGLGPDPQHLAITADRRLLVPRFRSDDAGGAVQVLNADFQLLGTVTLADDPGAGGDQPDTEDDGRGIPTQIGRLAVSPDGSRAWYPAVKANLHVGLAREGSVPDFENTVRTIVGGITLDDLGENPEHRVDFNDRDSAAAVAFTPLGDWVLVAIQGSNRLEVVDAYSAMAVGGVEVGAAPQGVVLSPDGRRVYVQDFLGRSLTVLDSSALIDGGGASLTFLASIATTATEPLSPEVLLGKRIFYHAADQRMSRDGYISCATCHLDGGHDGRTWDFTDRGEGLRNTITLHGRRGMGHGPVHWTANFDEIQDFEHDIRGPFGGSGFLTEPQFAATAHPLGAAKAGMNAELDALAAYVASLATYPRSPHRETNGVLTEAGQRGRAVFSAMNCQFCHGGEDFTDSATRRRHDIGTLLASSGSRLGVPIDGLDTPTLRSLWETAPYLHDGSAADLAAIFAIGPESGVHGMVRSLQVDDQADLLAFLQQLDATEPALPAGIRTITIAINGIADGSVLVEISPGHDEDVIPDQDQRVFEHLSPVLQYGFRFESLPVAVGDLQPMAP